MKVPCRALFNQGSPEISPSGSVFGLFEGPYRPQRVPGPRDLGRILQYSNKFFNMVREAGECVTKNLCINSNGSSKILNCFRGPGGSIKDLFC